MHRIAPYALVVQAAFFLGSCQSATMPDAERQNRRIGLLEINMERAARASTEAANRFERAEARIDALEAEVRRLSSR
jgi:hypothetical protein